MDKFEIMCLTGTSNLVYKRIVCNNGISASFAVDEPNCHLPVNGRVLEMINDTEHGFGVVALTDQGKVIDDFTRSNGYLLYNFPLRNSINKSK